MNKHTILFHFTEAKEELESIIKDLKEDEEYCEAELYIALQHLYHHVNSGWNGRDKEVGGKGSDEEWKKEWAEWIAEKEAKASDKKWYEKNIQNIY